MMRIFVPIVCGHVHANCSEHVGSLGSGKCHFLRPVFFTGRKFLSVPCPIAERGTKSLFLVNLYFHFSGNYKNKEGCLAKQKHNCSTAKRV